MKAQGFWFQICKAINLTSLVFLVARHKEVFQGKMHIGYLCPVLPKRQLELNVLMQSFLDNRTWFIKSNIILKPCAFQNVCVEVLYQYLETCWTTGRKGCNAQWGQSVRWQGAARGQLHYCERILSWMTLILIDSIGPLSHRFRFPQRHDSEKKD